MPTDYNKIINEILHDKLYIEQPIKMISFVFKNNKPVEIRTWADIHGYIYEIDENGKVRRV